MAVRHGYGKSAGADALVFAYDTGDTRNSYRGEPTTNLLPAGVAFGHNSGTYGNVVTVTDATSEKGPGWKKVTISNRGSNFRIIQWTYLSMSANIMYCHSAVFDWGNMRGKNYFIYFDGTGTGTRTYYYPENYSTPGDVNINSSMPNGKFAGTITHTDSHSHAFFIGNYTTSTSGLNDYFYYKEFQVEVNSHPTQYTTGTRSTTQGLLDLTGNSTIDLSNVSFNSSAEKVFDGTNDYIGVASSILNNLTGQMSCEAVFLIDSNPGDWVRIFGKGNNESRTYGLWYNYSSNLFLYQRYSSGGSMNAQLSSAGIQLNKYYHMVGTSTANTHTLYINGVAVATATNSNTFYSNSDTMNIGFSNAHTYHHGTAPVAKLYNRALTAAEVKNNYNIYRSRFDI